MSRLHSALRGRARLANASGVTSDNVASLLPHVDIFLVGTGIEEDVAPGSPEAEFYRSAGIPSARVGWVDAARVQALADLVHAWSVSLG